MRHKIAVAVVAAVAAVAVLVSPARAEGALCDSFRPPANSACETVIRVWCMVTRDNPICHL